MHGITEDTLKVTQPLAVIEAKWSRLFVALTHHRTTSGEFLSFHDKPWLEAIYKDNNTRMVVIKCAQVHMTEHFLCAMFDLARRGYRGMYVLPTNEHRKPFVSDRINRLKDSSPQYGKAVKEAGSGYGADSNVYKTLFGQGWKFVGANVRKNFFEFPCDVLILDEFDLLDQDNLIYAYDRLANSENPHIYKFGNPTSEGVGIDNEWKSSSQNEWYVECCHCGLEQKLNWYQHFVRKIGHSYTIQHEKGYPICLNCGKPFDRCGKGRWISENPTSSISGYRISRLFVKKSETDIIGHSEDSLYAKFMDALGNPTKLQNFHNNYLGMTYDNYDLQLTEALLNQAAARIPVEFESGFRTVAGVDQGRLFTVVISAIVDDVIYDMYYGVLNTWEEVENILNAMNSVVVVVDAQGGGYAETRKFVRLKEGRWMCYYRPKDQVTKEYDLKYDECVVNTNRTELLDTMVSQFKYNRVKIKQDWMYSCNGAFFSEMTVPKRVTDAGGRAIWTKGADHFFHASAYRTLAHKISGMSNSATPLTRNWNIDRDQQKINVVDIFEKGSIGDTVKEEIQQKVKRSWHVR